MKSIEIGGPRLAIVALALVAAMLAYVNAQGSVVAGTTASTSSEAPLERSSRASEVEGEITRTNLGGRVEAALGDAFGGVWFEPSTAQMHVGVVSPAGARLAEAAAAEVGLSELVTEIPVESTWAALDAVQEQWDRSLTDLLERGEVVTALVPYRNEVSIELGSAVSSARRAALERRAAAEGVDVSIVVAPHSDLSAEALAQCAGFKQEEAICEPTIVGGMTIDGPWVKPTGAEEEEGEFEIEAEPGQEETEEEAQKTVRNRCSAGVTAITEKPANMDEATKIYLLTSGHCINEKEDGGGVGGKWTAYNKGGIPKGAKEIGPAVSFLDAETDIGAIEVTTNYWAKAKVVNPVTPGVARLDAAESNPLPVIDKRKPMVTAKTCISGQYTGRKCGGEVIKTNQTMQAGTVTVKGLVEVKASFGIEHGDSGAPWYAEDEYNKGNAYVEGITVGRTKKDKNPIFHSLETSFEKLSENGLSLELLTTKNEKRHKPKASTESSPATIDGKGSTAQIFKRGSRTISCEGSTFTGTVANGAETVTLTPAYTGCTTSGVPATIKMNGCTYVLHLEVTGVVEEVDQFAASADLDCPEGKEVEIEVYANHTNHTAGTALCRYTLGETGNQGLATVSLTNKAAGGGTSKDWVEAHIDIEGVDSKRTVGTLLVCGAAEDTAGTMEGSAELKGTTGGESANGITVATG
jgi:hypothetical protein